MPNNRQRVSRCRTAIVRYGDDLPESNLIDFIADAMHFCRSSSLEFDRLLATARLHFEVEQTESAENPAPFDNYEIHGVREFGKGKDRHCEQVPDDEAQFWSLYGHIPGQGVECIGDFASREHAEEVYARITGQSYGAPKRRESRHA